MGVTVKNPGIVLDNQKLLKPVISLEVQKPFLIGQQDVFNLFRVEGGQVLLVLTGLNHNFMGSDGLHQIIHSIRPPVEIAFDVKKRKLVWNDTHGPISRILENTKRLARGHLLISRTKRTGPVGILRAVRGLKGKVV